MYKSILMLTLYGSLSIAMDDKNFFGGKRLEEYSALKNSFLQALCNKSESRVHDCMVIEDHIFEAQEHSKRKRKIEIYTRHLNRLSSHNNSSVVLEPAIAKLEEMRMSYPDWNKTYWNTMTPQEQKKIVLAVESILSTNYAEHCFPKEMRKVLSALD